MLEPLTALLLIVAAVLPAGCRREQIRVYHVPKASEYPIPMAPPDAAASPQIQYALPTGWREEAPDGLSLAKFSIAGGKAQLSVMTFAGEGTGPLELVNVVRQTAKLPALTENQLAPLVQSATIGGEKGSLIDVSAATKSATNSTAGGLMVALTAHAGLTWFFKLSGDAAVLTEQKPAFMGFLVSLTFTGPALPPPSGLVAREPGVVNPPLQGSTPAPIESANAQPAWDIPAGWRQVPPTQMLLAKFTIANTSGAADVTVSKFPGEVGGLLPNVNRWRGQVGLEPIEPTGLSQSTSSLDVPSGKATLVDVNGTEPKNGKETRLVGVIWPRNGETWFYKMTGNLRVVADQKDTFIKFVQSVRYPQ